MSKGYTTGRRRCCSIVIVLVVITLLMTGCSNVLTEAKRAA